MNTLVMGSWRCQFCHNTANNVSRMIAGDSGFICDECVRRCAALLDRPADGSSTEAHSDRYLFQRLDRHFAPHRPQDLLTTSRTYPARQQADLQRALDVLFGERRIPVDFVGIHSDYRHEVVSFSKLLERSHSPVRAAPGQYEEIEIGQGETIRCLKNGLWLRREGETPYVVLLALHENYGQGTTIAIEIAAPPGDTGLSICERIFEALERQLSKDSCYRGRVISLDQPYQWSGHASRIVVHELEAVRREDLILPEATLQAVERNVLAFARQRQALRELGVSTQKGLLFHGEPGTGKTHCIRYLARQLPDHTTLLITAEGVGLLAEYMALARLLQPAIVVVEDADLIARERTEMNNVCGEVMLNRLLNELDGLREQADIFFIMTTNRPGTLEPALANRPGRIDQAVEFPLPNEAAREQLIRLYSRSLQIESQLVRNLAARTEGASPAFIKEFMRRIAQGYVELQLEGPVTQQIAEDALHEMLFSGGNLNAALLGGGSLRPRT
jgi:hypothetical protein